ncbi:RHS repeat-associated core domain-containing protein [Flavobacterium oreochromis]|uniref:RHS repeat domain-containing protein n=1 Tax=Flavobacterium oreochromis TaxID=2906078 RepID=UPI00385F2B2A
MNYYPFGSLVPNRHGSSKPNSYRYGFNGKEDDWQIKGEGNSYDFGARFYDSRIGRFLSLDPLQTKFANLSPYIYAANNPVSHIDQDGKYALFIHYMLTRYKLMKSGISEVVANLIAHYSSTYTDNPASRSSTYEGALMGRVIVDKNVKYSQGNNSIFKSIGGALNGDQAKGILYKKGSITQELKIHSLKVLKLKSGILQELILNQILYQLKFQLTEALIMLGVYYSNQQV